MKRFVSTVAVFGFALFFLAAGAMAAEGYYMEEKLEKPALLGQPAATEIVATWILGDDLMRKDTKGGAESIIFSLKDDRMLVLTHGDKTYLEIPIEQFRRMANMGFSMFLKHGESGEQAVPEVLFAKTGRTKKVGQWDCYEVEVQGDAIMGAKSTQWIAKDHRIRFQDLRQDLHVRVRQRTSRKVPACGGPDGRAGRVPGADCDDAGIWRSDGHDDPDAAEDGEAGDRPPRSSRSPRAIPRRN